LPVKKIGPFSPQPDPPPIVAAGSGHFGRGRMFLNYDRQVLKDFHREPKIVRGKRRLRKHPRYWRWLMGFRRFREHSVPKSSTSADANLFPAGCKTLSTPPA